MNQDSTGGFRTWPVRMPYTFMVTAYSTAPTVMLQTLTASYARAPAISKAQLARMARLAAERAEWHDRAGIDEPRPATPHAGKAVTRARLFGRVSGLHGPPLH